MIKFPIVADTKSQSGLGYKITILVVASLTSIIFWMSLFLIRDAHGERNIAISICVFIGGMLVELAVLFSWQQARVDRFVADEAGIHLTKGKIAHAVSWTDIGGTRKIFTKHNSRTPSYQTGVQIIMRSAIVGGMNPEGPIIGTEFGFSLGKVQDIVRCGVENWGDVASFKIVSAKEIA